MNVLITGGLGHLGRELSSRLARIPGVSVITFSRGETSPEYQSTTNLLHERGSILDRYLLEGVIHRHGITHVVHAAGARTSECQQSLEHAREINVEGTRMVCEAALAAESVRRLVFLSSAAVYGGTTAAVDELHPVAPASNYAISKVEAERVVLECTAGSSLETSLVRPGFLLGRRPEGTFGKLLQNIGKGEAASVEIPNLFHLHGTSDLATSLAMLLTAQATLASGIFHLPGYDITADQFIEAVVSALPPGRFTHPLPTVHSPKCSLPQRLVWKRFAERFDPVPLTPFPEIVREAVHSLALP